MITRKIPMLALAKKEVDEVVNTRRVSDKLTVVKIFVQGLFQ